ncbi:cytochrome c maturation protein CcmE [Neptunomonas marina]|uniref:Cytochrome c-type biogenesis protein CcmE n=1 Tax=Neptunomonas marina TaxID=1815562 RepID=A0A437Q6Y9_9GAMM|nr:cytochrome c maturation protein CcmE [Neptunomonas marina]RVU30292.1 cytochrome c maturation protein CcmE [Neptunomonas marina]
MNPKRKQRLALVLLLVVGVSVAVGLALYALNQNINLFYSPTQIVGGEAPKDTRIRAGGMVVEGSVKRDQESLRVQFAMTDYAEEVLVEYTGILPDLFREGQGIVAQGAIDGNGVFQAVEVLAKHDENYMPPEVAEALEAAGKMPKPAEEVFNK